MTLPGSSSPVPTNFYDTNGDPLANGFIATKAAGTNTDKTTWTTSALSSTNSNPIQLDANGHADIFLGVGAYDLIATDANSVPVPTASIYGVVDTAQTYLPILGNTFATGARGVATGYTVLSTDYLITVDGTGGANPCVILLPAATSGHQLTIQNIGDVPVAITPHGADTINALVASAVWTMPAAVSASQIFPTAILYPDGTSNWRGVPAFPSANLVTATVAGVKMASGFANLASGGVTIATGLTTITSATLTLAVASVPSTTGPAGVGYAPSGGSLVVISWKADGSAYSGTSTVGWMATGT